MFKLKTKIKGEKFTARRGNPWQRVTISRRREIPADPRKWESGPCQLPVRL